MALVFGLLNTKSVQNYAKDFIVQELKTKLNTDLGINRLYFRPFNTVELDSVYIHDRDNNKILLADNISASIDLFELMKQNIVISSARLSDFEVHLAKESADSALNIQFIIDAFKPKDDKPKSKIELKISAVNINNGKLYYDVLDKEKKNGRFDQNHIAVTDFDAKFALKSLQSDTLNIQIRKFGLKEKSGLEITNLIGRLLTKDNHISIKGFELLLPDSRLELSKFELVLPEAVDSTKAHSHDDDIKLDFVLSQSHISPKDVAAFVPQLQHFDDKVTIKAEISGYEHSLKMSNLTLTFGDKLRLVANAEVNDWFDEGDTYILAAVDELTVSGRDIERLANSFSSKKVSIQKGILAQEHISFQGDISGYINQLTAFGTLDTDNGVIRTDVLFGFNTKEKVFSHAKGKIYTSDFNLKDFLQNDDLGYTSFSIAVDINKPLYKDFKGEVKGLIQSVEYKGYTYSNLTLDALYDKKKISGSLNIDDENGSLALDGFLDMTSKDYPILNVAAQVNRVQLGNLNVVKQMENSSLSFNIDANFVGSNIDNVEGYISIDSLELIKADELFILDKLLLNATGLSQDKNRRIEIKSDLINGYIEGESSFNTLINSFKHTFSKYLPALVPSVKNKKETANKFDYSFVIENTEKLSQILKLPVTIYEPATIEGFYKNDDDLFKVEIKTPLIRAGGMNILSGYIYADNTQDSISAVIKALVEGKNQILNDIAISTSASEDKLRTTIYLVNNSVRKADGTFHILTEFDHLGAKDGLRTRINIDESKLLLNNTHWRLEGSTISIDNKLIDVDNFWFHSEDKKQELKIHGKYSKNDPTNILKTELKDIDLEYLFETLAINALKFGGAASGNIFLSSIEEKPYANTRLEVNDFKFNGTHLGHLSLFSELNDETNEVMMDGLVTSKENKKTKVDGVIDPINQKLSIHFDADSVDIGFLHSYAQSIFEKISGRGTGRVHLHGDFSNVTVEGAAEIKDGNIGIKFLNTDYSFSDVVYLKEGLIYFNDIAFKDKFGNTAYGSGKVVHDYFQNIMYHIELDAKNFLVYNATEDHNPIFYGQVFGSGKGILGGDESEINIDINMQTRENTLVRMNFMEDEISEYSFITYVEPEKEKTATKREMLRPIQSKSNMNINMNFYIDATPDATFEMVMDPVGGDILRGSGSGAMQFIWSSKLEPQLFGTFNVNRGSYNFTFQRIMERKFMIDDGSTVQFRGDPFQAILDVSAIYKVTASLSDIDNTLVEQSGQSSVPVHCILNLTGQLKQPEVKLDIRFPTANAEVERQIKSYMDTEDMINRQVTYLLLLSKFYTPDVGKVNNPSSDFAVVASATLSNQLSKIINQVDDRWQLGTHIRMSDAEFTSTEVELLLSSQLLDDRLLINGNFGYRDDPNLKRDAVITDVDIEYLLNRSGTWRVKAYNHYNEKYYFLQSDKGVQTQGVGLMYRRNFDKISELFHIRRRRNLMPTDSIHHILPDSVQKGSALSSFIKFKEK